MPFEQTPIEGPAEAASSLRIEWPDADHCWRQRNAPRQDLPDDWDLLDLLGVVGSQTQPVSRSLDERQLLGLAQLVTLAGHLSPEQSQTVEGWLRG